MSSESIISVENLGKRYQIGLLENAATTFCELLANTALAPWRRFRRLSGQVSSAEHFWALRDVSFEIQRGEVVGIIGRNGAGKSTLLKTLAEITEPTTGRIELGGHVSSLLEVGTGFHPELTGRENIYLNGSILGMSRSEIQRKFDQIVSFAEVERFLETPVKRYSSGMYVRLAFAVAAHLESEILVVDEVLAVGDQRFQERCLGKMREVARSGRTILFVSHNMAAVRNLCDRAILLDEGRLTMMGEVADVMAAYSEATGVNGQKVWRRPGEAKPACLQIEQVSVELRGEQPCHALECRIRCRSTESHAPAFVEINVQDSQGVVLMQATPAERSFMNDDGELHDLKVTIDLPPMIPGQYAISVWVGSHLTVTFDEVRGCATFEIDAYPNKERTFRYTPDHGQIVAPSSLAYTKDSPVLAPLAAQRSK